MSDIGINWNVGFSVAAQPIVETIHAVGELVEDWSGCRSPSRAKRREWRGFPQHVKRYRKPACYEANGTLFIHPALARELRQTVKKRIDRQIDNDLSASLLMGDAGLALSRMGYRFRP